MVDFKKTYFFLNFNPVDIGRQGNKGIITNIILHYIRHLYDLGDGGVTLSSKTLEKRNEQTTNKQTDGYKIEIGKTLGFAFR